MEVKLAAQLGCLKQCPFWSFLDLRRAYDAMDQVICLKILRNVAGGWQEDPLAHCEVLEGERAMLQGDGFLRTPLQGAMWRHAGQPPIPNDLQSHG